MDERLQELNRQWDANPGDLQAATRLIAAFRRATGATPIPESHRRRYKYRNYPVNITDEDSLWAVSGGEYDEDGTCQGGGVLEWCISFDDANARVEMMLQDGLRFRGVSISKYRDATNSLAIERNQRAWCDHCRQAIRGFYTQSQAGLYVCDRCDRQS